MSTLNIMIVEKYKLLRQGLVRLIEAHPGWKVCSSTDNRQQAVDMLKELHTDIIVLDIGMPTYKDTETIKLLLNSQPDVKIIGLSVYTDGSLAARIIETGASGFVLKERAFEEIVPAIVSVSDDRNYISPEISLLEPDILAKKIAGFIETNGDQNV